MGRAKVLMGGRCTKRCCHTSLVS